MQKRLSGIFFDIWGKEQFFTCSTTHKWCLIRQLKKAQIFGSVQYPKVYSQTLRALSFVKGALKDFEFVINPMVQVGAKFFSNLHFSYVVIGSELAFSLENNYKYKAKEEKKKVLFKVQLRKFPLGNPRGFMLHDNNFGNILFRVLFN